MEYETLDKETPEMKQLISGIKKLTKRVRSLAQTHRPLFQGELFLTGREVCERLFLSLALCKTIEIKAYCPIRRLLARYFTDYRTSTGYWRRTTKIHISKSVVYFFFTIFASYKFFSLRALYAIT